MFGGLVRCPHCVDFLKLSRLTEAEQGHRLSQIKGGGGAGDLRTMGEAMLADPFGWLTVYGGTGTAKSLLLSALVAEFCRKGTRAVYYHARDLSDLVFQDLEGDKANREMLKLVPVLAIDEMNTLYLKKGGEWSWLAGELFSILDHRYRNMREMVTLMVWQGHPSQWAPEAWVSRMEDGRFNRTINGKTIGGLYEVKGADVRPMLRRTG